MFFCSSSKYKRNFIRGVLFHHSIIQAAQRRTMSAKAIAKDTATYMNEFTNWINVHWSNKLFIFSRISSALPFNGTITVHRPTKYFDMLQHSIAFRFIFFFFSRSFSIIELQSTQWESAWTVFVARYWLCKFSDQSNPCILIHFAVYRSIPFGYYNSSPLNLFNNDILFAQALARLLSLFFCSPI